MISAQGTNAEVHAIAPAEDLSELRVKIPRAMHQQLRVARLLQNRSMTEIVTDALGAALTRPDRGAK